MAFIIDVDHFADADEPVGTNSNAVGIIGPSDYVGDGTELTIPFRMLTSDRELVYEGRASEHGVFEPLDCFGGPNFGCTSIQYLTNGIWVEL